MLVDELRPFLVREVVAGDRAGGGREICDVDWPIGCDGVAAVPRDNDRVGRARDDRARLADPEPGRAEEWWRRECGDELSVGEGSLVERRIGPADKQRGV